ncbi:hypothetical protein, partial [Ureibacillus sinduriensis]|uniref:hypothetical protein n=1 Tax=Ureibacillus sinduriensis TaxID=561440 RepID=UPI001BFFD8E3
MNNDTFKHFNHLFLKDFLIQVQIRKTPIKELLKIVKEYQSKMKYHIKVTACILQKNNAENCRSFV